MPGDTVLVKAGVYRERVAPARSGTEEAPITYKAAPGENVVLRASETLKWEKQKTNGSSIYKAVLSDSLFDTLDGTANSTLYNPFLGTATSGQLQPNVGCVGFTTGQVHINGKPLAEMPAWETADNVASCSIPFWNGHKEKHYHSADGCFKPSDNGSSLLIQLPDALNGSTVPDSAIEVTVRSRVFAPHKRGLQYITVQGFVMEYAANNWCANMWFPDKAHWPYAQSGVLGTRSGYKWTIHNNTLRHGKTIGLDIGIEGGYVPAGGGDNEGTNQPIPKMTGWHTVTNNIIEQNGASGVQGYASSGNFVANIVRNNGRLKCGGAENAGVKTHGFSGNFSRNMIYANTNGVPTWFDSGAHNLRVSRNLFMVPDGMASGGVVFELTNGPDVLFDNNFVIGGGTTGNGVGSQDASNITLAHNLLAGFKDSAMVVLGGLTGRKMGTHDGALRSWWVSANVLLTTGYNPWISMHKEKHDGDFELVYNETATHNIVSGSDFTYVNGSYWIPKLKIDVSNNYNTNFTYTVAVDKARMALTLQRSAQVAGSGGCEPNGVGTDTSFTGEARSATKCVAGPLASVELTDVNLWAAFADPNAGK
jgi:hypothetical protein